MGYDAISNARLSAFAKDSARKKKGSRLGKLKQDKVDVRREQRLSQVKNKGNKVGTNGSARTPPPSFQKGIEGLKTQGNLSTRVRGDKHEIPTTFESDSVSWMTSTICRSLVHVSYGKDSFGSRSSYSGSCSSSCSEGERDDGCLDDWEAVADALTAASNEQISDLKQHSEPEQFVIRDRSKSCSKTYQAAVLNGEAVGRAYRSQKNSQAWSPDDVFRPECLPSLSKQTSEHCFSRGPTTLAWKRVVSEQQPRSCPICCEDLDLTDSNFLPCPCGFQLCLFCHKRILEVDARCPGCRKQYDSLSSDEGCGGKPVNSSL